MSKIIIEQVRMLPDRLRDYKELFVRIVTSIIPEIPFNSSVSHDNIYRKPEKEHLVDLLKTQEGINVMKSELDTTHAKSLLSEELIKYILNNMTVRKNNTKRTLSSMRNFISPYRPMRWRTPLHLRKSLRSFSGKHKDIVIDINKLAFRAYTIVKMSEIMASDSKAISESWYKF